MTDWIVTNLLTVVIALAFVLAFLIAFLRWLLTPVTWRNGEGPLIDEGERLATEFSWMRWLWDVVRLRFWRL